MEEGGLTLPTPAASLWRATREALTDALTNIGHPGIYRMGGGTILAARWRHRRSWDIDLQVDPGTDLGKLDENREFRAKMKALGGTPSYDPQLKLYRILFDDEQAIELWSHRPPITRGARREQVDGRNEWLLSTTQILRGKLERGHKKLARDVYDIRMAAELAAMIERPAAFDAGDVEVSDAAHAPGYGRLNDAVREAMALAARREALLLDPVYTGKAMAGLVAHVRSGRIAAGSRVLFVHTGGLPAVFAYADKLGTWLSKAPRGGAG